MKINNGFNILPWYDSLEKQNCKKWYAYGQAWPLLCPQGFILPFQFISDTAITISSNIYAISVETGQTIDLGVKPTVTEINRADITYYIVKLVSTSIVNLPIGRYNLHMNTSEGFLYSEELVVINNANECIKVEYWNEDTLKFTSGEINFTDDFHFIFYINSTIGKPEYEFEEELTKRLGYKFIESQTSNKVYKFSFVAPEYICDAMRLIRMCDYIKLTTKFDSYNALSFAYEPKWQEQGDLAAVDVEFDTDCIIQKLESFNRRAKESFYNALLADIDEPVLFSTDTVAQYYTEYTASGTISGKLIRQLTAISEDELVSSLSSIVLPVDNQSDNSQVAKKAFLSDIVNKLIPKVNLSDYLLKSVWDKVFEIRTDRQGKEYIFGKLPVVTQYGITMYANGGDIDLPSLYAGLPIDGKTLIRDEKGVLMVNPDIELGGGASNFWDLSGIPSWITSSKPKYTYSEIQNTPDLSLYAKKTDIPSLSGYATESWVNQQNYAIKATTLSGYGITDAYTKTNVDDLLKSYVTLGGTPQTITGEKNFTGGLKVNGSPIYYDTEKKYWKLEGDLLVTGGVTMYGSDSSFTPSTIMDAIAVDGTTISKSGGILKVIGGTGGGVADSVAWANITGKPTWIGSSKPSYSYSEITGAISTTELQNYLTQNSYLNATSGDNRYLKLSGGTVSGHLTIDGYYFKAKEISGIALELSNAQPYIDFHFNNDTGDFTTRLIEDVKGQLTILGRLVVSNGLYVYTSLRVYDATTTKWHNVLHAGNYSSYALPLSGGTINVSSGNPYIGYANSGANLGRIGVTTSFEPFFYSSYTGANNTIWHSGNDGSGSGLNADLLDGVHLNTGHKPYGNIPLIDTDGVMEVGKYIDFHNDNTTGSDFSTRLICSGEHSNRVSLPSANGTLALTSSNVASATKLQTARTIWGQSFDGTGNVNGTLYVYDTDSNNYSYIRSTNYSFNTARLIIGTCYGYNTEKGALCIYNGNVGIGTESPSSKLHVSGNILATGGVTMYSMRALKNVVDERGLSLSELTTIKPTRYTWKDGRDNRLHFGGIADDIQQVLPEVVYSTSDGILTMDYGNAAFAVASSLIKPVVDHEKRIAMLQERIDELEEEVERLKAS